MNTLFAKTVLICGCGFSPLLAADISGHWIFEGDVNGNPVSLDCNLKAVDSSRSRKILIPIINENCASPF